MDKAWFLSVLSFSIHKKEIHITHTLCISYVFFLCEKHFSCFCQLAILNYVTINCFCERLVHVRMYLLFNFSYLKSIHDYIKHTRFTIYLYIALYRISPLQCLYTLVLNVLHLYNSHINVTVLLI